MSQLPIPSSFIFEVSTYTTLSQTMVEDILNVWILVSVARNHNLLHIHLLLFSSVAQNEKPCTFGTGFQLQASTGKRVA